MIINKFAKFTTFIRYYRIHLSFSQQIEQFDYVYGVNSVQCTIHANRRQLYALYLSDSQHIKLSSRTAKIMSHIKTLNIPVIFTNKQKMSRLVKNQSHQNIIIKCSPLPLIPWKNTQQFGPGVYVYCDKITDPQNFGAILRSCLFFGVQNVFTGKKNHCPLNTTVSKTSSGASQLINTLLVQNSSNFISQWKDSGGVVVATSIDDKKQHIGAQDLAKIIKKQKIDKTLLILGSQGQGVSDHLLSLSDYRVFIERQGQNEHPFNLVDSLNVSAALSILLFELTRKY